MTDRTITDKIAAITAQMEQIDAEVDELDARRARLQLQVCGLKAELILRDICREVA